MDDPHRLQLLHTPSHVLIGVVIGNMGNANHDAVRVAMMQKPFQIFDHPGMVFPGIGLVNFRIHILDIHYIAIQHSIDSLHFFARYVQAGFGQ